MKIGIWGGTFDPPHLGHLQMMHESASALGLSRVLVVPNHIPPHKSGVLSAQHRRNMLSLICADDKLLELDCRELASSQTSYSIKTCRELRAEFPSDELVFCMGADSYRQFHTWYEWQDMLHLVDIAVVQRPNFQIGNEYVERYIEESKGLVNSVSHLQLSLVDVSSTDIRSALKGSIGVENKVPASVLNYITENSLYL